MIMTQGRIEDFELRIFADIKLSQLISPAPQLCQQRNHRKIELGELVSDRNSACSSAGTFERSSSVS